MTTATATKTWQELLIEAAQTEYPQLSVEEIEALLDYDSIQGERDEEDDQKAIITYVCNGALINGISDPGDLYIQAMAKVELGIKNLDFDGNNFNRVTGYGETYHHFEPAIEALFCVGSYDFDEEEQGCTFEDYIQEMFSYLDDLLGTDELKMSYNKRTDCIHVSLN